MESPRRLNVNLKNLPPINNPPRFGNGNRSSIPAKFEKSRYIRRVPQFMPPKHWLEMKPNQCDGSPMKPQSVPSDSARALNTETIPDASSDSFDKKKESSLEIASSVSSCRHGLTKEEKHCKCCSRNFHFGNSEKRAAKSLLFEICTANHWQPPLFECCEEEGPSHAKKYRFKVIVEMKGASGAVLECYGNPQTRKKVAAEHAAEGALWYLKHLGYCSKR